ncbi:MAG: hypothetical protein AAF480_08630 [Actinomycetota bacterium]
MKSLAVMAVVIGLSSGCSGGDTPGASEGHPVVASERIWTDAGVVVSGTVIVDRPGPPDCGLVMARVISIGDRVGEPIDDGSERRFLWAPRHVLDEESRLGHVSSLGANVEDTGLRSGSLELWHDPTDREVLYVVDASEFQAYEPIDRNRALCD